jgi:putative Mg2+ transporter-C (MgtC) family protein
MQDSLPFLGRTLVATPAATAGAVLLRLVVSAALGGVIGVEREMKRRPAGLRTNMFMCFGAALFTMLSVLMAGAGQDQTRIAAQIITGIGFIGAGTILHFRAGVQGVTTASTIFVVAAIGMCAGAGLMIPAALATLLVLFGLLILGVFEQHIFVRLESAVYQAASDNSEELFSLLQSARVGEDKHTRLLDVTITSQPPKVEFTLEAHPETHRRLRERLRAEFETHKIISFSSSEQE